MLAMYASIPRGEVGAAMRDQRDLPGLRLVRDIAAVANADASSARIIESRLP
jgi:hypothetical protein